MRKIKFSVGCLIAAATVTAAFSPISLTTNTRLTQTSPEQLHEFLASPNNWPKIVASSHSVESLSGINLEKPIAVGKEVDEIFGLPPLLPLSVTWKCVKSVVPTSKTPGRLEFVSVNGVPGIASDCRMSFDILADQSNDKSENSIYGSNLSLQMDFQPQSLLAIIASPVLTIDNALALQFLLPSVLESRELTPLNKFRKLMGTLYGIAGLAHAVDCLMDSQLLVTAGSPPFQALPLEGKALALLWCAVGPLSYFASRIGGVAADLGLIVYGVTEVFGAGVIRFGGGSVGDLDPFVNALVVQGIVALAWLYSSQKIE